MSEPGAVVPAGIDDAATAPRRRRIVRTAQEQRMRRRRMITYGLFVSSFVFMVNALVGEHGYLANLRAQREYDALQASIARLRIENDRYLQDARRLRHDPAALEEVARRELGLGRPGEILVILRDAASAAPAPAPPASK